MEAQPAMPMTMRRMKKTVRAFGFQFLGVNLLRFGALGFISVLFSFGFCGLIDGFGFSVRVRVRSVARRVRLRLVLWFQKVLFENTVKCLEKS
jgi:hypothetical protein